MKNKKLLNFFFLIIIIIVGPAFYRQIDFENLKFEKPALAIIYGGTLLFAVYCLIKENSNKAKNEGN